MCLTYAKYYRVCPFILVKKSYIKLFQLFAEIIYYLLDEWFLW